MNFFGPLRDGVDLRCALRHVRIVLQFTQCEQERLVSNVVPLWGDLPEVGPKGSVPVEAGEHVGQSAEGELAQVFLREVDGEVGLQFELGNLNGEIEVDSQDLLHELESFKRAVNGVLVFGLAGLPHVQFLWHNARAEQRPLGLLSQADLSASG